MAQTILYIEDNADNAEIVNKILEQSGYTVYVAEDGITGTKMAEQHQPDLIICDYHLPGLNGPQVVAAIREKSILASIPVIMLTADIYTEEESRAAGVEEYLNKPIRRNQLLRAIESLIS